MCLQGDLRGDEGLDEVFELIDIDGDGTISADEFGAWWAAEIEPNMEINAASPTAALHSNCTRQFLGPTHQAPECLEWLPTYYL